MSFREYGAVLRSSTSLLSFRYFVIGAITLNLTFLSFVWITTPTRQTISGLPTEVLIPVVSDDVSKIMNEQTTNQNSFVNSLVDASIHDADVMLQGNYIPLGDGSRKTACSYRTAAYMGNRRIELSQDPFVDYLKKMTCSEDGDIAVFGDKFVKFNNFIADMAKLTFAIKGGEKLEQVMNQKEEEEFFQLVPGVFKAGCNKKPDMSFEQERHLAEWSRVLECYKPNQIDPSQFQTVHETTLAIQRYEYVNLYHTMTDFYNAFVLMLIFGIAPSRLTILFIDAHPEGSLDGVWRVLFGNVIRAGQLSQPTMFHNLVWGILGYSSPLNDHWRPMVPYLEEFREFFLSRHNVSTEHKLNCARLNVVVILRRDYVAHPRNTEGSVARKFYNEEMIVYEVKRALGNTANVRAMQLDAMSMKDQLEAVSKCDILMGMHGAGMSHILFLPVTSGVIEFKPKYSNPSLQHFSSMAGWRGLPYTFWHNFDDENEKDSYKTYIPGSAVRKVVSDINELICKKMVIK